MKENKDKLGAYCNLFRKFGEEKNRRRGLGLGCLMPLSTIFRYILAVSFISVGNQCTLRKPPTCRKSLTNFIT